MMHFLKRNVLSSYLTKEYAMTWDDFEEFISGRGSGLSIR
jgi:hypothetical protein